MMSNRWELFKQKYKEEIKNTKWSYRKLEQTHLFPFRREIDSYFNLLG